MTCSLLDLPSLGENMLRSKIHSDESHNLFDYGVAPSHDTKLSKSTHVLDGHSARRSHLGRHQLPLGDDRGTIRFRGSQALAKSQRDTEIVSNADLDILVRNAFAKVSLQVFAELFFWEGKVDPLAFHTMVNNIRRG